VLAILGGVVGEFVGAQQGLSDLLLQYDYRLQGARVFAILIILPAMDITLLRALGAYTAEWYFCRKPDHEVEA
jgi:ABC-type nitrate/sulfonate/bicarbonate transport system permease component